MFLFISHIEKKTSNVNFRVSQNMIQTIFTLQMAHYPASTVLKPIYYFLFTITEYENYASSFSGVPKCEIWTTFHLKICNYLYLGWNYLLFATY